MPSCKSCRRIGINEFHIYGLWYPEVFIAVAIHEVDAQNLRFIFMVQYRYGRGLGIFGEALAAGFGRNAH